MKKLVIPKSLMHDISVDLNLTIVNRPWNGYETVRNIKVLSIDSFK